MSSTGRTPQGSAQPSRQGKPTPAPGLARSHRVWVELATLPAKASPRRTRPARGPVLRLSAARSRAAERITRSALQPSPFGALLKIHTGDLESNCQRSVAVRRHHFTVLCKEGVIARVHTAWILAKTARLELTMRVRFQSARSTDASCAFVSQPSVNPVLSIALWRHLWRPAPSRG